MQGFVADESRAIGTVFEHQLAGVKCFELGAVADVLSGAVDPYPALYGID